MNDKDYVQAAKIAFIGYLQELSEQKREEQALREVSKNMYLLYTSLVDAGFTENQALTLVVSALNGAR